jgi:hypothetical protein
MSWSPEQIDAMQTCDALTRGVSVYCAAIDMDRRKDLLDKWAANGVRIFLVKFAGTTIAERGFDDGTERLLDAWDNWCRDNGTRFIPFINYLDRNTLHWFRHTIDSTFTPYKDADGKTYANVPCPHDTQYWWRAFAHPLNRLCKRLGTLVAALGVGADLELYRPSEIPKDEWPGSGYATACTCSRCSVNDNPERWTESNRMLLGLALAHGITAAGRTVPNGIDDQPRDPEKPLALVCTTAGVPELKDEENPGFYAGFYRQFSYRVNVDFVQSFLTGWAPWYEGYRERGRQAIESHALLRFGLAPHRNVAQIFNEKLGNTLVQQRGAWIYRTVDTEFDGEYLQAAADWSLALREADVDLERALLVLENMRSAPEELDLDVFKTGFRFGYAVAGAGVLPRPDAEAPAPSLRDTSPARVDS